MKSWIRSKMSVRSTFLNTKSTSWTSKKSLRILRKDKKTGSQRSLSLKNSIKPVCSQSTPGSRRPKSQGQRTTNSSRKCLKSSFLRWSSISSNSDPLRITQPKCRPIWINRLGEANRWGVVLRVRSRNRPFIITIWASRQELPDISRGPHVRVVALIPVVCKWTAEQAVPQRWQGTNQPCAWRNSSSLLLIWHLAKTSSICCSWQMGLQTRCCPTWPRRSRHLTSTLQTTRSSHFQWATWTWRSASCPTIQGVKRTLCSWSVCCSWKPHLTTNDKFNLQI